MPRKNIDERRAYGRTYQANYRQMHPDKVRTSNVNYWKSEKAKIGRRRRRLRHRYGIDIEDYDQMLKRQNGHCAICPSTQCYINKGGDLVVDHNHKTGEVRGLLCNKCNVIIGYLETSDISNYYKYLNSK